jgi:hypothetical protein
MINSESVKPFTCFTEKIQTLHNSELFIRIKIEKLTHEK